MHRSHNALISDSEYLTILRTVKGQEEILLMHLQGTKDQLKLTINKINLEIATLCNPIDLSRILILLKLDISALFGYTGATFKMFLGSSLGMIIAFAMLWIIIPGWFIMRRSKQGFLGKCLFLSLVQLHF
jgi:hypothetical protein